MNANLKNNMLNDESLEPVSGGSIFDASSIVGADKNNYWEVIDNNGDTVARFNNRDAAVAEAGRRNLDWNELTWDQVCQRRREHGR